MRRTPPSTSDLDPDLELLHAAVNGDPAAFRALIDRHAEGLLRLARTLSRNRADAEDVLQETLLGAYRGMHNFAARSTVKTWLMHILTRQALKAWRRRRRDRANRMVSDDAALNAIAASAKANGGYDIDVMRILESLPPTHREVLVLKELRGLSLDEIAQMLAVPRGTIDSRLSRARAEMRQRITRRGWRPHRHAG